VHLATPERSPHELDLGIARQVSEATNGFDSAEIERLKQLVESAPALPGVIATQDWESRASLSSR
jgi:hypothetical protein